MYICEQQDKVPYATLSPIPFLYTACGQYFCVSYLLYALILIGAHYFNSRRLSRQSSKSVSVCESMCARHVMFTFAV